MPSTIVHAGFALLLAAGLLGSFYDRRALAIVLVVVVFPEVDTLAGWVMDGAHRTLLHNAVVTAVAGAVLLWDTRREESWLRGRFGDYGVRVAWVCLFVHTFAHLALDWAHLDGVNMLWPLHDQFFRLEGELYLSTHEGLVQTFVEIAEDPETGTTALDVGGGDGRGATHVANPAQPTADPTPEPVDRRFPIAFHGWQLFLVVVGLFVVAARRLQSGPPERE